MNIWLISSAFNHPKPLIDYLEKKVDQLHALPSLADLPASLVETYTQQLIIVDIHQLTADTEAQLKALQDNQPRLRFLFTTRYADPHQTKRAQSFTPAQIIDSTPSIERFQQAMQALYIDLPLVQQKYFKKRTLETEGMPVRAKITVPYVFLTIALLLIFAAIVSQLILENLEERFTNQLIEAGTQVSDLMVREEAKRIETLRLVVNTTGVKASLLDALEAGEASDAGENLREIILPLAVNSGEEAIEILDTTGTSLVSLRHRPSGNIEDYISTKGESVFTTWPFVQSVLREEAPDGRDKHGGIVAADWGDYFYVAGPIKDTDGNLIGVILVGKSISAMTRQMRQDTFAQVTAYDLQGTSIASSFPIDPTTALEEAQIDEILANSDTNSFMRHHRVGSLNYSEILTTWELEAGTKTVGMWGVALPQTFFVSTSRNTQIQLIAAGAAFFLVIITTGVIIANRITRPLVEIVDASTRIAQGDLNVKINPEGGDEVTILAQSFNKMVENLREGNVYRDILGRAVTPEVREELRQSISSGKLRLEGQVQKTTLIFSDIRQFTTISEIHGAQNMFRLLNEYFDAVIPPITQKQGLITEFAGDALMAFFGLLPTPLPVQESARRACTAAIYMEEAINQLNQRREQDGQPPFVTGIAVNTGEVSAGSVGTADRLHYSVIGDTVNTAHRLEGHTKTFGETGIIVSQYTIDALGDATHEFVFEPLGSQMFKGKAEPLATYRLRGFA